MIKAAFPQAFRDMGRSAGEATVALWSSQMAGIPPEVIVETAGRLIKEARYAPTLADMFTGLKERRTIAWQKIAMHEAYTKHGIESPYTPEQIAEERRISAALRPNESAVVAV